MPDPAAPQPIIPGAESTAGGCLRQRIVWCWRRLRCWSAANGRHPIVKGGGTPPAPITQSADPDTPASPAEQDEDREQQKSSGPGSTHSPEEEIAPNG